jgi:hypothetical protein
LHPSNKKPYSGLVAQRNHISISNSFNQNTTSKNKPSSWQEVGIQMIKRERVGSFIGATPHFSDRKIAGIAGVSHTFVAIRRKLMGKL